MKNKISTSISQSNRLLSCGVDPKTADMVWTQRTHRIDGSPIKESHQKANLWLGYPCKRYLEDDEQRIDTPAWSLSALCSLIPSKIIEDNDPYDEIKYRLLIYPYLQGWQIGYQHCEDDEYHCLECAYGTDLIDACVKAIEWLMEQGYPLNNIEE